jgi:hypothetical protein
MRAMTAILLPVFSWMALDVFFRLHTQPMVNLLLQEVQMQNYMDMCDCRMYQTILVWWSSKATVAVSVRCVFPETERYWHLQAVMAPSDFGMSKVTVVSWFFQITMPLVFAFARSTSPPMEKQSYLGVGTRSACGIHTRNKRETHSMIGKKSFAFGISSLD